MRGDPTETSLSQAAKKDIDNGIASASIKNLYNYLSSDSIKNFLASKDCYPGLEVGPIKTGHASNLSTYDSGYRCPNTLPAIRSCHQYGKALDISAFEKKDNSESIRCMEEVKALINKDLPGQFKVQGPEGKNPPHLHVEDIDCAGNICSYPRP